MLKILLLVSMYSSIFHYDYQIEEVVNGEVNQEHLYLDESTIEKYDIEEGDNIRIYFQEYDDNIICITKLD